ncbi:hypothetical protein GEMRC1_002145 [Eukaryota sp. GEM-RC1]
MNIKNSNSVLRFSLTSPPPDLRTIKSPPRKQKRSDAYDHYEEYSFSQEGSDAMKLNVCKHCPDNAKKCYSLISSTDSLLQHVKRNHPEKLQLKSGQPLAGSQKNAPIARVLTKQQQRTLLFLLMRFMILNSLPLRILDSAELLQALKFLNSTVKLPKRNTMKTVIVRSCNTIREKVFASVSGNKSQVSLTTDIWTSVDTKSFIAITAHFFLTKTFALSQFCWRLSAFRTLTEEGTLQVH